MTKLKATVGYQFVLATRPADAPNIQIQAYNKLCEECNVWSSTINIPHGNGDILDISAACTPKGAAMYPEKCPNGLHGSYYTFDPSIYGDHSWPDLKSMLMTPGCVSGAS
jgi:hypothetical protein